MRAAAEAGGQPVEVDASGLGIVISADQNGHVVVRVAGELDTLTSPRLEEVLTDLIDGRGVSALDIDLVELGFADSTALGVLVAAHRRARADGGGIRLRNPRPNVLKVLQITGLTDVFVVDPLEP